MDALTAPLASAVPLDLTVGDAETMTVGDLLPDPAAARPDVEAVAGSKDGALAGGNQGQKRGVNLSPL